MRIFIFIILLLNTGCAFITGFAGNIASDAVNRQMEKLEESKGCKNG